MAPPASDRPLARNDTPLRRSALLWLVPWLAAAVTMPMLGHCPAAADDGSETFGLLVGALAGTDDPAVQRALLSGILGGLEGRRNVPAPEGWSGLAEKLGKSPDAEVRELTSRLSQIFGDRAAMERALAVVQDRGAEVSSRRASLHSLLSQQSREASSLLASLLDQPEMALDAIRGYAMVENPQAPSLLLDRFQQMDAQQRRATVETLASREPYAERLLDALAEKRIPRDEIPAHVARSLAELLGERFVRVYGPVRPVAQDRERLLAKYKAMLTEDRLEQADAARGRAVFNKSCAACHTLYGEGGQVGPDLTGSNRANLDYILLNSVDPSYDVPEAYRTVQIRTTDGRVINGVLAEEDEARVVLRTPEQPRAVIAKEDIDARKISPKSMMPDGQLDAMQRQEVADLIKYLRTTEQVELER